MPTTFEAVAVTAVLASVGTGAAIDLCTRRIPNLLTVPVAALGMTLSATHCVELPMRSALLGFVLGGLVMLPGYLWGGTGGGDVKLFAAIGAFLGPDPVVRVFLYSAVAGGLLAVAIAVSRGRLISTVRGVGRLVAAPRQTKKEIEAAGAVHRFPYGPAIATGTLLVVFGF